MKIEEMLNMRWQLVINWRYFYSAERTAQSMLASRSLPTIVICSCHV